MGLSFAGKLNIIPLLRRKASTYNSTFNRVSFVKKDSRPINVGMSDLISFKWPITAIASIAHRIAGAALFVGIALFLFALDRSLSSEAGFESLKEALSSPIGKLLTWAFLSALSYHLVAGVKHLVMDMGFGETLEGGVLAARLTLLSAAGLFVMAGIWVYGG